MDNNMTSGPSSSSSSTNRLQELILSLDQAALMARQLPATSDPALLRQIHSILHHAHHSLSSFLSTATPPHPPPHSASAAAENSLSSAHNGSAAAEPMHIGEDEEAEEDSRSTSMDRVEERMRNCFIKSKRTKRPLSPSAAAEDEEERVLRSGGSVGFDPQSTRLRALDLVYQFHG